MKPNKIKEKVLKEVYEYWRKKELEDHKKSGTYSFSGLMTYEEWFNYYFGFGTTRFDLWEIFYNQFLAEVNKVIDDFFRGQKVSLNKKSSILPKDIQHYTNGILDRLKEKLKQKLFTINFVRSINHKNPL